MLTILIKSILLLVIRFSENQIIRDYPVRSPGHAGERVIAFLWPRRSHEKIQSTALSTEPSHLIARYQPALNELLNEFLNFNFLQVCSDETQQMLWDTRNNSCRSVLLCAGAMVILHILSDLNGLALLAYYFNAGCDPIASKFISKADQVMQIFSSPLAFNPPFYK